MTKKMTTEMMMTATTMMKTTLWHSSIHQFSICEGVEDHVSIEASSVRASAFQFIPRLSNLLNYNTN